jgi:nucleotide-binding universal stress UspA family protein
MIMKVVSRTGLAWGTLASVAMRVVHRGRCPVLVVRPTNLISR